MCTCQAVLAMTDPLEWGRELQIVCDVLSSPGGDVAAAVAAPSGGDAAALVVQQVPLFTACADFTYAARWPTPRFGAGAFRVALEELWRRHCSGGEALKQTVLGKPFPAQYAFVEAMLNDHHLRLAGTTGTGTGKAPAEVVGDSHTASSIERFYMVGDNPETDIRGARGAGSGRWRSCLTRSGLWAGESNDPTDPADIVVDDVLAAVRWILAQEE